jgi:hypothetical protein
VVVRMAEDPYGILFEIRTQPISPPLDERDIITGCVVSVPPPGSSSSYSGRSVHLLITCPWSMMFIYWKVYKNIGRLWV